MGILFVYVPYVYWKMVAYQHVTSGPKPLLFIIVAVQVRVGIGIGLRVSRIWCGQLWCCIRCRPKWLLQLFLRNSDPDNTLINMHATPKISEPRSWPPAKVDVKVICSLLYSDMISNSSLLQLLQRDTVSTTETIGSPCTSPNEDIRFY